MSSSVHNGLRLKLGDVPEYPFVNDKFDVHVYLVDEVDQRKHDLEIPLKVSSFYEGDEPCPSGLVDISGSCVIGHNGVGHISITIKQVSSAQGNKRIYLQFKAKETHHAAIASVKTPPMCCVRHKLVIEESDTAPYVWYKDEGGKDKCIDLKIHLRDADDRTVHNRRVPLKATLLYACGQEVQQQSILQINPESRTIIDETGEAIVKYRVNEVSTRHRSQMFRVLISPDPLHAQNADISPAMAVPVDVKSKRNHRPSNSITELPQHIPMIVHPRPKPDTEPRTKKRAITSSSDTSTGVSYPTFALAGVPIGSTPFVAQDVSPHTSLSLPPGLPEVSNPNMNMNMTSTKNAAAAAAAAVAPAAGAFIAPTGAISNSANVPTGTGGGVVGATGAGAVTGGVGAIPAQLTLGAAVDNVIRWASTVMDAVDKIQWRPLGYEQLPDGSHDFSRPLYSIPDPRQHLVNIVQEYEDPVIASLHFLNAAAEVERLQQQGGGDGAAPAPNEAMYGHPGDGDVGMPSLDRLPSLILERMPTWGSDIGSLPSASAGDDLLLYRSGALPTSPTLTANMSLGAFADQQFAMEADSVRRISLNRSTSFSQAIPDVPQLTRNHSLYLGADNRTLEPGDAGAGAAASGASAESDSEEGLVHFIHAKLLANQRGALGIPAFSSNKKLVGVYREEEDGSGKPFVQFVAEKKLSVLKDSDRSRAVQEFTSALSKGDQAVFTLTAYALQGGLEKMKQKAMNYAFDEADVAATDAPSLSADISGLVAVRQDSESSKGRSPRSSRK